MTPKRSPVGGLVRGVVKIAVIVAVLGGGAYGVSKLDIDLAGIDLAGLFGGSDTESQGDPNQLQIPGTASVTPEGGLPIPNVDDAEPTAVAEEPSVEAVIEAAPQDDTPPEVQTEVVTTLQPAEAAEPAAQEAAAGAATEAVEAAVADVEPEVEPVVPAPQVSETTAPPATPASAEVAEGMARITLTFTDVSWVNIKDAKGDALFNGLAERGRTLELTGEAPVNFVFGRADAITSFTFNGATVDLAPHTKNNVARLSLPR